MKFIINKHEVFAYTANHEIQPEKPSVIFVHGAANDHSVFALQSRYFAYHGYNAIAIDLPGHGLSGGDCLTRVEDMAAWLLQVINTLELGDVSVAGHSMGSLIALEVGNIIANQQDASDNAFALKGLILCANAYPMLVAPPLLQAADETPQLAYEMINEWSFHKKINANPNPGVWQQTKNMRMMQRAQKGVLHTDLSACNNYQNGEVAAENTNCPVLFLCGQFDKMAPAKATLKIESLIANSSKVTLPDCGHALLAEQPVLALEAIKHFLAANATK